MVKKTIMKGRRLEYLFAAFLIFFFMSMNTLPYSTLVTVDKNAPWILFYGEQMDSSSVLMQDFRNQGWQIQTKIKCESRSSAAEQWALFKGEYGNNPALCVINDGQTPIYSDGAYYWAWFIYSSTLVAGKTDCEDWIYGNGGHKYDADDYTLVKFGMDGIRPLIIIWTGERFDTGNIDHYVYAWRWVAVFGADPEFRDKDWYIFNGDGLIIDSQIIPTNQPDDPDEPADPIDGNNPETNPNLNDPEVGSNDPNVEIPPVNPNDLIGPGDSGEYSDGVVSSLLITEIAVIGFLIVGLLLVIKHKKKLKR